MTRRVNMLVKTGFLICWLKAGFLLNVLRMFCLCVLLRFFLCTRESLTNLEKSGFSEKSENSLTP